MRVMCFVLAGYDSMIFLQGGDGPQGEVGDDGFAGEMVSYCA